MGSIRWIEERKLTLFYLDDENQIQHRTLGLLVARGTLLTSIAPLDGSEEIANPFLGGDEAGGGGGGGEANGDGEGGVVMEGP